MNEAHRQGRLFSQQKMLQEVFEESSLNDGNQKKLRLIVEVINYARKIGINVGLAYQTYISLERPVVSYTVLAAHKFKLENLQWTFPFVGSVPYLGYYSESDRNKEADLLSNQGYDVYKGAASAFSSLGYFPDPVFSSFLTHNSESELIHLIFHELIHRHFWIPGQVEINERLAEFGARILTLQFMDQSNSIEIQSLRSSYLKRKEADLQFSRWLKEFKKELQIGYEKYRNAPLSEKQTFKNQTFAYWLQEKWPKSLEKKWESVRLGAWNNARLLAYSLYSGDDSVFIRSFVCYKDFGFVFYLDELKSKLGSHNPMEVLEAMCG